MNENEMIDWLSKNVQPKYVKNYDNYKDGDFVQYSGQLWDHEEISAALDSLLNGKWVVSGEKVAQFQNKFSKRFNVKHSLMVNSGSSANLVLITAIKRNSVGTLVTRLLYHQLDFRLRFLLLFKMDLNPFSLTLN